MGWKFQKPFAAGRSNDEGSYCEHGGIVDETGAPIVGCDEYDVFWGANRRANLALLMAAPDMLDALMLYDKTYASTQSNPTPAQEALCMAIVRDAIRKALSTEAIG